MLTTSSACPLLTFSRFADLTTLHLRGEFDFRTAGPANLLSVRHLHVEFECLEKLLPFLPSVVSIELSRSFELEPPQLSALKALATRLRHLKVSMRDAYTDSRAPWKGGTLNNWISVLPSLVGLRHLHLCLPRAPRVREAWDRDDEFSIPLNLASVLASLPPSLQLFSLEFHYSSQPDFPLTLPSTFVDVLRKNKLPSTLRTLNLDTFK
jgi:hypothetical protein